MIQITCDTIYVTMNTMDFTFAWFINIYYHAFISWLHLHPIIQTTPITTYFHYSSAFKLKLSLASLDSTQFLSYIIRRYIFTVTQLSHDFQFTIYFQRSPTSCSLINN